MDIEQIIKQLSELIDDRKSLMDNDSEHDDIYIKDINALECAISEVEFFEKSAKWEERTAHWDISCDGYYPFCSGCGEEPPGRKMTAYCPNCGRRMVTPERVLSSLRSAHHHRQQGSAAGAAFASRQAGETQLCHSESRRHRRT